ncbi:MAG TPA: hypothetical protein VFK14_00235 [Solirubrobacterales bacterium]|nr:hypothetical protein [Solirubrobacterales bacterium]
MAFAKIDDVTARVTRPLTAAEVKAAEYVLEAVSGLICETAGRGEGDLGSPIYFKVLCVEKAVSAISNPLNVASQSETLGSYQHSETFPQALDSSAFLTEEEERKVRQISNGFVSSSTRTKSLLHDSISREPES